MLCKIHFILSLIALSFVSASITTTITTTITMATTTITAATSTPTPPTKASPHSDSIPTPSTPDIWSPIYLDAATYSLIIYDAIAMGLLCWLWLAGHLAWMKKDRDEVLVRDIEMVELERMGRDGRDGRRAGRGTMIEGEMRRLGLF